MKLKIRRLLMLVAGAGTNNTTESPVPVPVSGLASGVSAISVRGYHTCALEQHGIPGLAASVIRLMPL